MATNMTGGWVKKRRGIRNHIKSGAMNIIEYVIFDQLLLMASPDTGIAMTSNKGILVELRNGITEDQCKRAMQNLTRGGYIKSGHTRGIRGDYPILINKYEVTRGTFVGKFVDAEASQSASKPQYVTTLVTEDKFVSTSQQSENSQQDSEETPLTEIGQHQSAILNTQSPPVAAPVVVPTPPILMGVVAISRESSAPVAVPKHPTFLKELKNLKKQPTTTPVVVAVSESEKQVNNIIRYLYQKLAEKQLPASIPVAWKNDIAAVVEAHSYKAVAASLRYANHHTEFWKPKFVNNALPVATFMKSYETLLVQAQTAKPVPKATAPSLSSDERESRAMADYDAWKSSCPKCGGKGEVLNNYLNKVATCGTCTEKKQELTHMYNHLALEGTS